MVERMECGASVYDCECEWEQEGGRDGVVCEEGGEVDEWAV